MAGGRSVGSERSITLFQGNVGSFPSRSFSYWCTTDASDFQDAPDGRFVCPSATSIIEVNRNNVDQFRVKCAM